MADVATKSGFDRVALASLPVASPAIEKLRDRAYEDFVALPLPSAETEEWRYTDVSSFEFDFAPFTPGGPWADSLDEVPEEILAAAGEIGDRAGLQIQRNSEVILSREGQDADRQDVHFESLDHALRDHPEIVEPYLHAIVPVERTKFAALHAAFRAGGTFLYVPDGAAVELPLQTLTYIDADGAAVFPHTLIVVGNHAEVTFIDRYVSPDLGRALSDAVVEIHAGVGSRVRYISLQEWGAGVTHVSVQRAYLARDAELRSLSVAFGADLSRTEFESVLGEPGAYSEMLGLYFAAGSQHFDHRTLQDHVAPHCTSDLLYKGALKGASRAIYSGWVTVRPDAQKTDAFQTNRNVVLSDAAKADSIPNLEIEANDVKCGHAASVGPVDENELFYLQTRGIARREAERLIVFGFFQEVLDRVTLPEVREGLARAIETELEREH